MLQKPGDPAARVCMLPYGALLLFSVFFCLALSGADSGVLSLLLPLLGGLSLTAAVAAVALWRVRPRGREMAAMLALVFADYWLRVLYMFIWPAPQLWVLLVSETVRFGLLGALLLYWHGKWSFERLLMIAGIKTVLNTSELIIAFKLMFNYICKLTGDWRLLGWFALFNFIQIYVVAKIAHGFKAVPQQPSREQPLDALNGLYWPHNSRARQLWEKASLFKLVGGLLTLLIVYFVYQAVIHGFK